MSQTETLDRELVQAITQIGEELSKIHIRLIEIRNEMSCTNKHSEHAWRELSQIKELLWKIGANQAQYATNVQAGDCLYVFDDLPEDPKKPI